MCGFVIQLESISPQWKYSKRIQRSVTECNHVRKHFKAIIKSIFSCEYQMRAIGGKKTHIQMWLIYGGIHYSLESFFRSNKFLNFQALTIYRNVE